MIKKLFFIKTSVFAIALMISQFAFAGQAGTVTYKTGDVSIIRADKTIKQAAKNDALNAGDTIETKDGRLQLALIDGGRVSLQPNTIYKINKYEFSGKEDGTEYGFTELIKGGLRTISGLIGHKNRDRYQLKTAVATIGIRGTEFTVNFNDNNLLMTTNNGSVDVCNSAGCLNAMTGQSIEVIGVGAKPKPSGKKAAAAAAAAASSKAVFTLSDAITEDGLPAIIANQALANFNGSATFVSLMKTSCACGFDGIYTANIVTDSLSRPTNIALSNDINLTSFSSYNTDGIVAWGRASGDFISYAFSPPNTITWQDYAIGRTPNPSQLANLTGTYNVFASTAPILLDANNLSTTVGASNTTSGSFTYNFNTTNYNYSLNVNASGQTFNLTGTGSSLNPANPSFQTGGSVTGAGCGGGTCSPALQGGSKLVQGSFLGINGERIGLQYGFNSTNLNGAVYGSAVLK
jgi:hypothetical protein